MNTRPIDPDDPIVRELFQRFGKNEIPRSFSLFEADDPKVCAALAFLDCHHPIVF